MNVFVIVNCVEGRVDGVYLRKSRKDAVSHAVGLVAEQCDRTRKAIRAELERDLSFQSPNGDIVVTIHECELPGNKE